MELDLVSNLSIKPPASYGDHMHKHRNEMADLDYVTVEALSSHLPKWRESKELPSKKGFCLISASLCRVCGSQVYVNGGFYSLVAGKLKEANIVQRIAELFVVEDDSV